MSRKKIKGYKYPEPHNLTRASTIFQGRHDYMRLMPDGGLVYMSTSDTTAPAVKERSPLNFSKRVLADIQTALVILLHSPLGDQCYLDSVTGSISLTFDGDHGDVDFTMAWHVALARIRSYYNCSAGRSWSTYDQGTTFGIHIPRDWFKEYPPRTKLRYALENGLFELRKSSVEEYSKETKTYDRRFGNKGFRPKHR